MDTLPKRRSVRHPAYDYASNGAYFVTIVTAGRACVFGDVVDGAAALSTLGDIVLAEWHRTTELRPSIELDEFVLMPNHAHGIIWITDEGAQPTTGMPQHAPTNRLFAQPRGGSLSTIINASRAL